MPSSAVRANETAQNRSSALQGQALFERRRGRYMLLVLFLVGVFNIMDRQILSVLLEPIRLEFEASDRVMGLLTGFAFVLFYSLSALPIARLADIHSRRTIIAVGLTVWSLLTAASGLATSLWQLALARMGVGIGEASYLPAGMSAVSDRFPPERRTLAMSVFAVALPVGFMTSLVLGSWLGNAVGWRMALVWLGLTGLALAALVGLTVREPERGGVEPAADRSAYDSRATLAHLWSLRSFRHLTAGAALSMFAGMALRSWGPAFLMRVHDLNLVGAGASLGLPAGLGGIVGVLLGGAVAQRLSRRDSRWLLWMPALMVALEFVFMVLFLAMPAVGLATPMFIGVSVFGAATHGPVMAAAQGLAKVRMRALAAALVSFAVNLVGAGLGPATAGFISDAFQPTLGDESLRLALLLTAGAASWAAIHFALGARHLTDELEVSAAERGADSRR